MNLHRTGILVLVSLLIGVGALSPEAPRADDTKPIRTRASERSKYYAGDDDDDEVGQSAPKKSAKSKPNLTPKPKPEPKRPVKQPRSVEFDDEFMSEPQPKEKPVTPAGNSRVAEPVEDDADEPEQNIKPIRTARHQQVDEPGGAVLADPATSPEVVGNGRGMIGRASHLAGKTFGRTDSITPFEAMPYLLTDEHFVFADVRGFVTNNSQGGGNFGIGYRRLMDDRNAWAGASFWYDADQSTGKMFQQVGLSFEGLVQRFEMRSNVYLPFTSAQTLSNSVGNASIVGNQLLFGRATNVGTALQGVDFEVGYSQPIQDRHVVRGFLGGYHFDGGSLGGINGFKARVEGVINNTVTAQVLYTHDKLYGSNAMVGVSLQFPFARNHPTSGWTRNTPSPFRFVERNYNVIVENSQTTAGNQVAADPATGKAYVIDQIYSPGPGAPAAPAGTPDGTSAHPFTSLAAAQASGGNVFIVQSGSVLNQAITLTSGQHLFGQGNFAESLATVGGGNVQIPNLLQAAQSGSSTIPIIQNVNGTAVTLASNSEVAGFNIVGPTGNGITGSGVSGVSLHDLIFSSIGGDAINLSNSSGNVSLSNIQVNSATGNGIVFNGGNANISYFGSGTTITAQGNGFVLENLTGGTVGVSGLSLSQIGNSGLVISDAAANINVDSLTVSTAGIHPAPNPAPGPAVAISGLTGTNQIVNGVSTKVYNTYNFTGDTKISSPGAAGFAVSGSDANIKVANLNVTSTSALPAISLVNATNPIEFGSVAVTTQNGTGLFANSVTNLLIDNGSITTVNAPAVDVASTGIQANFGSISANGGPFGVRLLSSTGGFMVHGNGAFGSGGTIQNTTSAGVLVNSAVSTSLTWMNFTNNAAAIQSTGSTQLALSNLSITGSTGYAIDSLNDKSVFLASSTLSSNGAVGGGSIRIQSSTAGSFVSVIQSNNITDSNGTAIQFLTQAGGTGSSLSMTVASNTIAASHAGSPVIAANWNGTVSASVGSNLVTASGANMTGLLIQDPSLTNPLTASIGGNKFTFVASGNVTPDSATGIWIIDGQSGQTSTSNSTLAISTNTITFAGTGSTGLRYGLYATSSDTITQNAVIDQAGGATGMLFDSVASNSVLTITGNSIQLLPGDKTSNHGFVFTQINPTVYMSSPSGATTNLVYYPTTPQAIFTGPTAGVVGGIIVNNGVFN